MQKKIVKAARGIDALTLDGDTKEELKVNILADVAEIMGETYTHNQLVPSATWLITHNMTRFPSVTVFDNTGSQVIGEVNHTSEIQLQLTFSAAFAGVAYLN